MKSNTYHSSVREPMPDATVSRARSRLVRPILAVSAILLLVSLSACGQRGPLYLPQPDAPNQSKTK